MSNIRIKTINQILGYLQEARNHESELIMKEVWEDAERCEFDIVDEELDVIIGLLNKRKLELENVK